MTTGDVLFGSGDGTDVLGPEIDPAVDGRQSMFDKANAVVAWLTYRLNSRSTCPLWQP